MKDAIELQDPEFFEAWPVISIPLMCWYLSFFLGFHDGHMFSLKKIIINTWDKEWESPIYHVWGSCGKAWDGKTSVRDKMPGVDDVFLNTRLRERHADRKTERIELNAFRTYWMTRSPLDHSHWGTHWPATLATWNPFSTRYTHDITKGNG